MESPPRIDTVEVVGVSRLLVRFRNGQRRLYDCAPLFSRPEFRLIATPAFFRAVRVDPGGYGVSWNDDIDLAEEELWTRGQPVGADPALPDPSAGAQPLTAK